MNIAFSFLDNRIAPDFDSARRILVVEIEAGSIRSENPGQDVGPGTP